MKQKHLSIGQRLKKARRPETKRQVALNWVENWKDDHDQLIRSLERAIQTDDYDLLCRTTGQLKAVGEKRFAALPNVILHFADAPGEEVKDDD